MIKVVVFGLGSFGMTCAKRLYDQGAEVLAVDRNRHRVDEAVDLVTDAIACDATQRENLEAYDVGRMDAAVVAMGSSFEASVLVTMLCRELGVERVVVKAVTPMQQRVLYELGADQVIIPEEEMGQRIADHLLRESIVDFVELPAGYSLRRVTVPPAWAGESLASLDLTRRERMLVVQIVRPPRTEDGQPGDSHDPDAEHLPLPDVETRLQEGDLIDLVATDTILDELQT